jgi:hypothetical protein
LGGDRFSVGLSNSASHYSVGNKSMDWGRGITALGKKLDPKTLRIGVHD